MSFVFCQIMLLLLSIIHVNERYKKEKRLKLIDIMYIVLMDTVRMEIRRDTYKQTGR